MITPERLTLDGRWWRLDGHDIDLQVEPVVYPQLVRAAVLAFRDAETDEDADVRELLLWAVEEHPPWTWGCSTCRTSGECRVQNEVGVVATEWLAAQMMRRFNKIMSPEWQQRLRNLEAKNRVHH